MLSIFVEKHNNLSDNELIAKIRDNDQEAFETLFSRYRSLINYLISKNCSHEADREDFFQDATISFYYATQMYDFSSSSFKSFLSLCIERSLKSTIKKANAQKRIPSNLIVNFDDACANEMNVISAEEEFFVKNSSHQQNELANKLSKLELKVLNSFLKTGSYDDTAKELSLNRKSVDNALVRVRKKLNS